MTEHKLPTQTHFQQQSCHLPSLEQAAAQRGSYRPQVHSPHGQHEFVLRPLVCTLRATASANAPTKMSEQPTISVISVVSNAFVAASKVDEETGATVLKNAAVSSLVLMANTAHNTTPGMYKQHAANAPMGM